MRLVPIFASILFTPLVSAEVCVQNDTNLADGAFQFGFTQSVQIQGKKTPHPTAILPSSLQLKSIGEREAICIEYTGSEQPGAPGHLVIYAAPSADSKDSYGPEIVFWISDSPLSASADSALTISVERPGGTRITLTSKMDDQPFKSLPITKVYVPYSN